LRLARLIAAAMRTPTVSKRQYPTRMYWRAQFLTHFVAKYAT
jgi:hypothetical protein